MRTISPVRISIGDSQATPVAKIQAVTAVPILAPSSTTCAMRGRMRSRSAKEATVNAVAVELCRAMVARKPDSSERNALLVPVANTVLSLTPKARVTPSFTCARPNNSRATAPNRLTIMMVDCMLGRPPSVSILIANAWPCPKPMARSDDGMRKTFRKAESLVG